MLIVKILYTGGLSFDKLKSSSLLTEKDRALADGFLQPKDKIARLSSAYLKRKYVGDWEVSDFGKPISKTCFFNISHCDGLTAIVIADNDVGIDVEKVRPINDELKHYVCAENELEAAETDIGFFTVWTNKESLSKAEGSGLTRFPNTIPALPLSGKREFNGEIYFSRSMIVGDNVLSVTRRGGKDFGLKIEEEIFTE